MTAKIKLNAASGGGSFSLQAPSSSRNNRVISLPDIPDGTLVTSESTLDATKLSGNLPALNGSALTNLPAGGKFASYAIIIDQKGAGYNGGTFTSGAWRTRDLNTEIADADSIVSISSNQFTLQAGTYKVFAHAPAYKVGRHQIALYDITASNFVQTGSNAYSDAGMDTVTVSFVHARFTISGATVYEIRHRSGGTFSNFGFGVSIGNGTFTTDNNYTYVEIFKES